VELRDRVGAAEEAEPGDRHVEGIAAEGAHLGLAQAAAGAQPAELAERVDLVPAGNGRVGGEHDARAHGVPRLAEPGARPHALAIIATPAKTAWPSLKW